MLKRFNEFFQNKIKAEYIIENKDLSYSLSKSLGYDFNFSKTINGTIQYNCEFEVGENYNVYKFIFSINKNDNSPYYVELEINDVFGQFSINDDEDLLYFFKILNKYILTLRDNIRNNSDALPSEQDIIDHIESYGFKDINKVNESIEIKDTVSELLNNNNEGISKELSDILGYDVSYSLEHTFNKNKKTESENLYISNIEFENGNGEIKFNISTINAINTDFYKSGLTIIDSYNNIPTYIIETKIDSINKLKDLYKSYSKYLQDLKNDIYEYNIGADQIPSKEDILKYLKNNKFDSKEFDNVS